MTVLDHGKSIGHKILHTGAYHTPEDKDFKKRIELKKYLGITHNNINFESWIKSLDETNNIFIDLDSNFVEYRLNYIHKMPNWNEKLNYYATSTSWKGYEHPIAFDDARRIVRLHQNKEQQIVLDIKKDVIFKFKNFYISDPIQWTNSFLDIGSKLNIELSNKELLEWYRCFNISQKIIIERAKLIYECIDNKKFIKDLNENEKGIIIGYNAVLEGYDDAEFFYDVYKTFSSK